MVYVNLDDFGGCAASVFENLVIFHSDGSFSLYVEFFYGHLRIAPKSVTGAILMEFTAGL